MKINSEYDGGIPKKSDDVEEIMEIDISDVDIKEEKKEN